MRITHQTAWPSLKLNYWGIPKSGSSSIKHALILMTKRLHVVRDVEYKDTFRFSHAWVHSPSNCDYISRDAALCSDNENFTVVRDPYDRFYSGFKDMKRRGPEYFDLPSNVDTPSDVLDHLLNCEPSKIDQHFAPQHTFIFDEDENFLCDRIFFLEDNDLLQHYLCTKIGHINHIDKKVKYKDDDMVMIENLYEKDFEYLGY